MLVQKIKSTRSKKILAGVVLLVVVATCAGYAYHVHSSKQSSNAAKTANTIDYTPAKTSDNASNEARKDSAASSNSPSRTSETLNQPATTPPFSVTVSRANPYSSNGTTGIAVAATINGASAIGTCTITLTPVNGQGGPITQPEASILSNSTYICPGINVPAAKGDWKVGVTVSVGTVASNAEWALNPVTIH